MDKNVNRLLIYKSDGSTIVDVTENLTSLIFNGGSVQETGDTIADNPVLTLNFNLKNTNKMQFSPHFEKGKYVYDHNYNLTLIGVQEYDLPFPYTIDVVSLTEGYHAQILDKKIYIDSWGYPLNNTTIKLGIVYIDTTVNNPLNYIGNEYAPLIKTGNRVSLYRDMYKTLFKAYTVQGNNTNQLTVNETLILEDVSSLGTYTNAITFYEWCSYNFYDILQDDFYQTCNGTPSNEVAIITNFSQNNGVITITFDRIISDTENINFYLRLQELQSSELKFDGYINQDPQSDIETIEVSCIDRAWDLQNITGLTSEVFRKYDAIKLTDTTFEVIEQVVQANLVGKIAVSSYMNYTNIFTQGQEVRVKVGSNYVNCTISIVTTNTFTLDSGTVAIPDGKYAIFKVYPQGIPLPRFLQNCLEDVGLGYNIYDLGADTFNITPKSEEMEYDDLWNMFQSYVVKTANILMFKNINGNFELTLNKIPLNFSTPKYEIESENIWDDKTHWLASTDIRTSWKLKFQLLKNGKYTTETIVKDDFIQSLYTVTVLNEGNIINTDELLIVNDFIRINKEYYKVLEAISSNIYRLNKIVIQDTTYVLYKQGQYTDSNGLKQASIELDNTSAIDTMEEANTFTDLLLYQTKEPYSNYKITLNADRYELNNFDTIKITCPEFSLYNENVFVQSVQENYSSGNNRLTITFSKKQQLGKNKFKEMITERGLNKVVSSNKINTTDIFPPPQNLVALDPAIDDLNNYVVYSRVSWNDLIGRQVAQWEIQYSTDVNFSTYETQTLNTTETKLILKEQKMYYIRVRGVSKEQIKGEWSNTTVDASKFLIENPIQNRTFYIRLFQGNSSDEYFARFSLLGYTADSLNKAIDTIEIIPSPLSFNSEIEFINTYSTGIKGIQKEIQNLGITSGKNLRLNGIQNNFYSIKGYNFDTFSSLNMDFWNNIEGVGICVFKMWNTVIGFDSFGTFLGVKKNIRNIKLIAVQASYNGGTGTFRGFYNNVNEDGFDIQNCSFEIEGNKDYFTNFIGFDSFKNLTSNYVKNSKIGFKNCYKMFKNKVDSSTTKYDTCYYSESANSTYLIATTGSDNVNGGFNT